jgi:hypothetical protein
MIARERWDGAEDISFDQATSGHHCLDKTRANFSGLEARPESDQGRLSAIAEFHKVCCGSWFRVNNDMPRG